MAAHPTSLRAARASSSRVRAMEAAVAAPPQPDYSSASRELAKVLRWTLGIPTAAIVTVFALYLLGAIWWWGEIQDAGLVPTDVLSLVPHSQILGRGLQLVVLALLALPLPLAFAWLLHRILPERERPWGVPSGLGRLMADHNRLRSDLDELRGADPTRPKLDKRVSRMRTRADTQKLAQDRRAALTRAVIAFAVVVGLLVLSPARLAVALFALWLMRRTTLSRLRLVAVVFGAMILAVGAERFTAPDPLPDASVRTTRGVLLKGPLVAQTQSSWHIVISDDVVKSIPTVQIAKASVYSEPRMVRGPLGARVVDAFR